MNSIAFPFPQVGDKVLHSDILLEGEELDAPFPVGVMVNKPVGYVVTAPDDDKILDPKVYDLLPYRCVCVGGGGERLGGRVSSDCVRFPGWRHPTTVSSTYHHACTAPTKDVKQQYIRYSDGAP